MHTLRAILTKREIRAYTPAPLPDEVALRILRAGRASGSSTNSQPWRFVLVRERARLQALARCGRFAGHLAGAAAAVAVVIADRSAAFDAGRAAQNMMLAAWDAGVASCPASMHRHDDARRVLGVPDGWVIAIVLAFGYPDREAPDLISGYPTWAVLPRTGRRRLEEIAFAERWDVPVALAGPYDRRGG